MSVPIADQLDLAPQAKQARRRETESADDGGFARLMAQHQDTARASTHRDNTGNDSSDDAGAASRPQHTDGRSHRRTGTSGKGAQSSSEKAATAGAGATAAEASASHQPAAKSRADARVATAAAGMPAAEASHRPAAKSRAAAHAATAGASMPAAEGSGRPAAKSPAAARATLKGAEPSSHEGGKKPVPAITLRPSAAHRAVATSASSSRASEPDVAANGTATRSEPGQAHTAASASRQSAASNANTPRIDADAIRIVVGEPGGKVLARPQGPVNAATAVAVTTAAAQGSAGPSSAPEAARGQTAAANSTASAFAAEADHTTRKADRENGGRDSQDDRKARPVKGLAQAARAVSGIRHGQQHAATDPAARAEAQLQLLRQAVDNAPQRAAAGGQPPATSTPDAGARSALQTLGGHNLDASVPGMESATSAKPGGEVVTRGAETQSADRSTPPQPLSDQVAVRLQKAAANGRHRVSVRLQPAELGRIDVKLDIGKDGVVRALVSADRADTLDVLQRDSRELDKALQNAGLQTDSGSLDFNLRSDGDREGPDDHELPGHATARGNADPDRPPQETVAEAVRSPALGSDRIDIRV